MTQLHKRFSAEQVKVLLKGYQQGSLTRIEIQEMLGVGKTRFFAILKQYQHSPEKYDLKYIRPTGRRLSAETEQAVKAELKREKELVEDPDLPISSYD